MISSVPALVKDAGLTDGSKADFWCGEWETVGIMDALRIEQGQRILLRLRPSLFEALEDCPELEKEFALQPKRLSLNKRTAAHTLVSPAKVKIPRGSDVTDVSQVRNKDAPQPTHVVSVHLPPAATAIRAPSPPPIPPPPQCITSRATKTTTNNALVHWMLKMYVVDFDSCLSTLEQRKRGGKNEKDIFEEVFGGRYAKTSVSKYKKLWSGVDPSLKVDFITKGRSEDALVLHLFEASKAVRGEPDIQVKADLDNRPPSIEPPQTDPTLVQPHIHSTPTPSPSRTQSVPAHDDSSDDSDYEIIPPENAAVEESPIPRSTQWLGGLCPFCDTPMAPVASKTLQEWLIRLHEQTFHAPTAENPHHRVASSITVYAAFCTQHKNEAIHLPPGVKQGWPTEVHFSRILGRIRVFSEEIQAIFEDPEESAFFAPARELKEKLLDDPHRYEWESSTRPGAG